MTESKPPNLKTANVSKRFGSLVALDDISLELIPGCFHALLGENGAGKSTLAKCIMGDYIADKGTVWINDEEQKIDNPRAAHALGIGMVYQHFSLVPNMTVAENLVVARIDKPTFIDWSAENERLDRFLETMPFDVNPSATVISLAAGEKQKVEILKQLYLNHRILILDEPTTVLTPEEADRLFDMLLSLTRKGELSVLLITHKFREVFKFAQEVTVLRRGRVVARGETSEFSPEVLAKAMIGDESLPQPVERAASPTVLPKLEIKDLYADNDRGICAIKGITLKVRSREIVGIAGVSGNGQKEMVEVLAGQRERSSGEIRIHDEPYSATRVEIAKHKVSCLPEEPLRNASVQSMSVEENLAFRDFFETPFSVRGWLLSDKAIRQNAVALIGRYRIKASSPDAPIRQLSGGNIQRAVLARELARTVEVLVAANPCFGLDVAAAAEIHAQIMAARNRGAGVLLVSEDLDEIFALSDRVLVMFEGRVVHETEAAAADMALIGRLMAGHHDGEDDTGEAA